MLLDIDIWKSEVITRDTHELAFRLQPRDWNHRFEAYFSSGVSCFHLRQSVKVRRDDISISTMRRIRLFVIMVILSQLVAVSWAGLSDKIFRKAGVPLLAAAAGGASLGIVYGTLLGQRHQTQKGGHYHQYNSYKGI